MITTELSIRMAFAAPCAALASHYTARTSTTPLRPPVRATLAQPRTARVAETAKTSTPSVTSDSPSPPMSSKSSFPSNPIQELNGEEDLLATLERSVTQLVVIRVHARWCRSCRALEPKWRRLAREIPDIHFAELEFEANKALAARLSVEVMPTFLVYDAELGRVDKFSCGPKRAFVLRERIEQAIENRRARLAGEMPAMADTPRN